MLSLLSVQDLADGAAALDLDERGVPVDPVVALDLSVPSGDAPRAIAQVSRSARAVVGVCSGLVPLQLAALRDACAFVLTDQEQGPTSVVVADVSTAAEAVVDAGRSAPRAAGVLMPLLRLTADLPVLHGLAAESHAYSMLLAGPEFAEWRGANPLRGATAEEGEAVEVSRAGDVLKVVLNRPRTRNAYSREVRDALVDALDVARVDSSLSVDLRANGPSFCSGGHLDEFGSTTDVTVAHHVRMARSAGALLHDIRERTVVGVHGACVGAGVELPAFAGRVRASSDAWFSLPELAMGLVPGAGGTVSVTARIGRWRTAWMVLSGAPLDVATALSWGLVDEHV